MKASELRIGNWIYNTTTKEKVQVYPMMINQLSKLEDKHNYKPIELTEEILLKCGFVKQMEWTYCIDLKGNLKLVYYIGEKGWSIGNKNYSDFSNLKHLHQLQNLYFCLCGKELEINL
jgi:hypothetical protein